MTFGQSILAEYDQEMATTRRLLARVPSDKGAWKPHEKSFPLGHLAQLVATMPGWLTMTVNEPGLDLAAGGAYSLQSTEALLEQFDRLVAESRAAMAAATDAQLDEEWALRHGEKVLMKLPRRVVLRQTISHLVHHRGQLTVYLRLLDVGSPGTELEFAL